MKVIWEVNDGYVGGSRPHETIVPDDELEECETEEEREDLIYDYIHNDFRDYISWSEVSREEE